jgi:LPS sulfotransferase NodH
MERIIIATSPRTGSNLLMYSLESHSLAVSGGEWFAKHKRPHLTAHWDNRHNRPEECNLVKLFSYDHVEPSFDSVVGSGVVIYLYRKDRAAQLASWKRACETGIWSEREPLDQLKPIPFRKDANDVINRAYELFGSIATYQIAYENLIEHWDYWIRHILRAADWPHEPLTKQLNKQSISLAHDDQFDTM